MKKAKIPTILCFAAALLFYIAAAVSHFISGTSMTVVWICLGSAFLCLGAVQKNKLDKDAKN